MIFRRSLLDIMPGKILDERYFMYGEDHLWCYQFTQKGVRNYYFSETTVVHIHGASTDPSKQLKLLKTFIKLELDIMKVRKGSSLYYFLFSIVFVAKERARYYIKVFANNIFGIKMR